jgi:hypothetical protein
MHGVDAEPGTVLGPNTLGERLVVSGSCEHGGVSVRWARSDDVAAVYAVGHEPRSVAEHRMLGMARTVGRVR